ncbi:MAG: aldo/keto reductase [Lachnospiraceae bacterium]|nr:aldo/keto reductase [Lachnospiraceae bacterium]
MKKLGFGAMRLPLTDANDKAAIDQELLNQMVDAFMEAGFTYFDTAYLYHDEMSEPALKKALVDRYPRESYILADKMPTIIVKSPEDYEMYFKNQLERTGAGYFDYYLMHNMGKDRYTKTKEFGGFEFAMRMKAEGKIKKFGFSFHDDRETLERILKEHPEVDFVQLQINYLDWENDVIQSRKCYETAVRYGKPVVVMEPVKGGMLANLPEEAEALFKAHDAKASPASYALRFAASLENVMMVLSGMSNLEQVSENILVMDEVKPITEEETILLKKVTEVVNASIDIPCTACGYCMEVCPKNIAIPGLFGLYNNYKTTGGFSNMYYNRIVFDKGKASDCIGCHLCEKNCPQHIEIPEQLKKITEFEKQ